MRQNLHGNLKLVDFGLTTTIYSCLIIDIFSYTNSLKTHHHSLPTNNILRVVIKNKFILLKLFAQPEKIDNFNPRKLNSQLVLTKAVDNLLAIGDQRKPNASPSKSALSAKRSKSTNYQLFFR